MMEKIKIILVSASIFAFIYLSNCSPNIDDGTKVLVGEGPLVTEVIQADSFSVFQDFAIGNVSISTGDSLEISIRAQQNIIDEMKFEFRNGIFVWSFREQVRIGESDSIFLFIKMPNAIEAVQVAGLGIFYISGVKQENFIIDAAGFSEFNCYGLEVDKCEIYITGKAVCRVRVNEEISGTITGEGDVYYRGNPEITIDIFGDGNIQDDNP
jgi:hypothetical protein